ncbi:translation elongation factor Ts [candidate division WOR-3 bacterium]|nr:translation elongation factor Ts [candidate division WOR-3 bacterium]MCK4527386.1 translation elongation factor Ts [candidate division WOR-3 bacterium]
MATTKEVDIELIKKLRAKTSAGILDCKNALIESNHDIDKAIGILRKKGILKASKKMGRETGEGVIYSYIHPGSRLGSLIELNCETDFVARTDDFMELAKEVAMQVVAMNPIAVDRKSVPDDILEQEKSIYEEQAKRMKKPEEIQKRIVESKIENFYKEVVLLEQGYFREPTKTIGDLIKEKIAVIGENIVVKRFERYELGE